MKVGISDMNIMLLSIFEFHEHWHVEGLTFRMGINELTFTHVPTSSVLISSRLPSLISQLTEVGQYFVHIVRAVTLSTSICRLPLQYI